MSEYYAIRSRKFPEGQRKKKKYEKRNSNTMGEFRPIGSHSIEIGLVLFRSIEIAVDAIDSSESARKNTRYTGGQYIASIINS